MRVLLVEDDPTTSRSIELMLSHANLNVYCTDLGEEGIDLAKLYDYDLILLDLNLPDMNGHEVLRQLRMAKIDTPILILSGSDDTDNKIKSFGFGADDYLTKPFEMSELLARIASLLRRSKLPAFGAVRVNGALADDLRVDAVLPRAWIGATAAELTQREWELLGLLITHTGQVVSRENVLSAWQSSSGAEPLQSNALEVYVHRLRRKLAESPWMIRNIRGLGYMLERASTTTTTP